MVSIQHTVKYFGHYLIDRVMISRASRHATAVFSAQFFSDEIAIVIANLRSKHTK
jgi:hypothetical protein